MSNFFNQEPVSKKGIKWDRVADFLVKAIATVVIGLLFILVVSILVWLIAGVWSRI